MAFLLRDRLVAALALFGSACYGDGGKESALAAFAAAPSSATTAIVRCETSVGALTIDVKGHWSPKGAQRFLDMIDAHWFENLYMPRVVRHYLTQFGPRFASQTDKYPAQFRNFMDDPPLTQWFGKNQNISLGTMFFAGSGKNSRNTDMCIALCQVHCAQLGSEHWETPFAVIRETARLAAIDKRVCTPICKGRPCADGEGPPDEGKNCDMPPFGIGPGPGTIHKGEAFLKENFPKMQHFKRCSVQWRAEEHTRALDPNGVT